MAHNEALGGCTVCACKAFTAGFPKTKCTCKHDLKNHADNKFKMQLSDAEKQEANKVFRSIDTDGSGSIDSTELCTALKNLKMYESDKQVENLLKEVDKDGNNTVEFPEFLDIVLNCKLHGAGSGFATVYSKQKELVHIMSKDGGTHSFSVEEMSAFSEHLNDSLKNDPDCKHLLPIAGDGKDLTVKVKDGILLSKFINVAVANTIDRRALNLPKKGALSLFQLTENQILCIEAAKSIGVVTTNIGASELIDGPKHPHLVLGLVWQLVKMQLINSINLKNHPALIRLLEAGETLQDLLKLTPEQLLLRWFNYHLKNANHPTRVKNFKGDVKDATAYTVLLNQIAPTQCDKSGLDAADELTRAEKVLGNAAKLNVHAFIKAKDITSGNKRLNLAFTAAIFNQCPGLDPPDQDQLSKAGLLDDDNDGDSREERAFRMWINSLGVDGLYINNLFADLGDGLSLLKVIDFIEPGIVIWKKVELSPNNKFKKVNNNNYAIELGKGKPFKCSLPGTGGEDIVDGKRKLILGFVWQLMRYHILKFLDSVKAQQFGGKEVTEKDMVKWCNDEVKAAGPLKAGGEVRSMKSFKDTALGDSLFFLELLHTLKKGAVEAEYVIDPANEAKEKTDNARYAISVARKLGATIFLLPEDIVEVKPKMVLTFVASIMSIKLRGKVPA
eukprot:gb/GEZN01002451.1/.p1 GENE.gb/GEZN01002451.1/~~gb/GEZN01002451.1/.p1  ORF type:complete len:690 (+),score=115.29 gb/GEZN01002451.1/:57-2072(+)